MEKKKLWDGRFQKATASSVERYTQSISFDCRLAQHDVRGSIAHINMLAACGIITKREAGQLRKGLRQILKELELGNFKFKLELEDVHLNIEARLIKLVGEVGKKLHTARSRNDQVALDMRLYLKDVLQEIIRSFAAFQGLFIQLAERYFGVPMPGFTHLQHAQPVLLSHHLLAYFEMFQRDRERFNETFARADVLPLGAAALGGTTFPIDRKMVAEELGFSKVSANSIDTVADRDLEIELCANAAICMMHLSRLCEELVLWSSSEFGFVHIGDPYTTGSSIMPQKRNPDVAELCRGKTGRVYGDLISLLTVLKGLPLSYNRDLQEDKEAVFDCCDTLISSLNIITEMLGQTEFVPERMEAALKEGFILATDLADYLVAKGVPFRDAHRITGKIVQHAEQKGQRLEDLSLGDLKKFSTGIGKDVKDVLSIKHAIAARKSYGGTAPSELRKQLRRAKRLL